MQIENYAVPIACVLLFIDEDELIYEMNWYAQPHIIIQSFDDDEFVTHAWKKKMGDAFHNNLQFDSTK